ncbi:hypothetical protein F4861DRAFT_17310 [Xylaria intraflava]|nr:hypothetical protein F4861DRAFT_17310 [Xylaria intraflava]
MHRLSTQYSILQLVPRICQRPFAQRSLPSCCSQGWYICRLVALHAHLDWHANLIFSTLRDGTLSSRLVPSSVSRPRRVGSILHHQMLFLLFAFILICLLFLSISLHPRLEARQPQVCNQGTYGSHNQSIKPSINQSVNQAIKPSISQSINQSINSSTVVTRFADHRIRPHYCILTAGSLALESSNNRYSIATWLLISPLAPIRTLQEGESLSTTIINSVRHSYAKD